MRKIEKDKFPVDEAINLLREKCFEYCTLADKDDQLYLQKSIQKRNNSTSDNVIISPIIAIYVTTIMEHIAEYLLTAVAISAEHEETDYARVKEVYLALVDDVQLGSVFSKMNLKEKMEKRFGLSNKVSGVSYLPTSTNNNNNYNNNRKSFHSAITTNNINSENETGSVVAINIEEDLDLDFFDENLGKTNSSSLSLSARPHSRMSLNTNNHRKSTFHVLKNNRNSFSNFDGTEYVSSPSSIYDPDNVPTMNFDDLVRSGGTVKVSLTPNRLKSIEVKDPNKEDTPSELTWERRSVSSSRVSTQMPHKTPKKYTTLNVDSRSRENSSELPRAPKSPVLPQSKKSDFAPYENPREAPKPPIETSSKKQSPPVSQYSSLSSIPSSSSSDSISSSNSSVPSVAPPSVIQPPHADKENQSAPISIQEINTPKPTKSISIPTEGMVLRRSSVSSRKSRENLRRVKSIEGTQPKTEQAPELPEIKHGEKTVEENVDIEVPSSMVAKRASNTDRRRSLHENFAAEKHGNEVKHRGSVSTSIKQWDSILKSEESSSIPPAAQRRSLLRQMRQQQLKEMQQEKEVNMSSNAVLDRVLQFERVSEDVSQNRVSSLPRRERFLYLQQDPSAIERKSTVLTTTRLKGVDQSTQTEGAKKDKEEGLIDGDEEWFLQDDEWDEQEEISIVEWLLCE
ncbi:unnamed protein product [Rhizopus stolonifer]